MVRFHVTVNSQSSIYLPEAIREELGTTSLELLSDAKAILLYPDGTDIEQILKSLRILKFDLEHRRDIEKSSIKSETRIASAAQRGQRS